MRLRIARKVIKLHNRFAGRHREGTLQRAYERQFSFLKTQHKKSRAAWDFESMIDNRR